jgi:hypothetical protein
MRRWGRGDDRRNTRDLLGWIGHGYDSNYRMAIWSTRLNGAIRKLPSETILKVISGVSGHSKASLRAVSLKF